MSRILLGTSRSTKAKGTLQERVTRELEQLAAERRTTCTHERRHRNEQGRWVCLDCGAPV